MAFAARALSTRALTVSELREKLKRRAGEASDVEDVLARLKEAGYLNDQRFAESYAELAARRRKVWKNTSIARSDDPASSSGRREKSRGMRHLKAPMRSG